VRAGSGAVTAVSAVTAVTFGSRACPILEPARAFARRQVFDAMQILFGPIILTETHPVAHTLMDPRVDRSIVFTATCLMAIVASLAACKQAAALA